MPSKWQPRIIDGNLAGTPRKRATTEFMRHVFDESNYGSRLPDLDMLLESAAAKISSPHPSANLTLITNEQTPG